MIALDNTYTERIKGRIEQLTQARERVVLLEKQAKENSKEKLAYNSQAASIFDSIYELQWVLRLTEECEEYLSEA